MTGNIAQRSYSTGERIALFVVRLLTVSVICAIALAIAVTAFSQMALADSDPVFGEFMIILIFAVPFTLAGFLLFGLPAIYCLKRLKMEGPQNFAFAGIVTGSMWGAIIGPLVFFPLGALAGGLCGILWWSFRLRS